MVKKIEFIYQNLLTSYLYSIRVNQQYRLEFQLENDNITLVEVVLIEELSKHYE